MLIESVMSALGFVGAGARGAASHVARRHEGFVAPSRDDDPSVGLNRHGVGASYFIIDDHPVCAE